MPSFATRIDPEGIELFEQPCAAEDWEANAAVAAVSRVPLMLDEPICGLEDIEHGELVLDAGARLAFEPNQLDPLTLECVRFD